MKVWLKLFLVVTVTLGASGFAGYFLGTVFENKEMSVALSAVAGILIGQIAANLISLSGGK